MFEPSYSARSTVTNNTGTEMGLKPELQGDRPPNNRLSHGAAMIRGFEMLVVSQVVEKLSALISIRI